VTEDHAATARLAWLDGLRGIAALLVVYEHLTHTYFTGARLALERWVFLGYVGVCVFFLVSGYIIPASLERGGSLRRFWISRVARLYPMYLVAVLAVIGLSVAGIWTVNDFLPANPGTAAAGHLMMMPGLLGVPELLGVIWTLAFEMAFYLIVSALFQVGRQRASGPITMVLAGSAFVAGASMPTLLLSRGGGSTRVVVAVGALAVAAAVAAMLTGHRTLTAIGAVGGGLVAVLLLVVNQHPGHRWDGLLLPALMFTGTVIYRVERGQISRWWAIVAPVTLFGVWIVQGYRELRTMALVAALFAAGFVARHARIPRAIAALGLISYSVYLLHPILLQLFLAGSTRSTAPWPAQALAVLGLVAIVLAVSAVTYRLIELPAQRFGRTVARRATPDRVVPTPTAAPEAARG
jgi:peptidoglycan/LPS O-acetylase OafA/YrhL